MFDATPFLRSYAAFRSFALGLSEPASVQRNLLEGLVRRAAATRFGREHGFSGISSVEAYQAQVPLRHYEDFYRQYWQPDFPQLTDCTWPGLIPYFALSSGTTTGKSKYIPCSKDTLFANWRGLYDLYAYHVLNRPLSTILGGKTLVLGGSTVLSQEAPAVFSGDLSGIEACEVAWWEQPWVFPPKELALSGNWEEKIDRLARMTAEEDIRSISGAPNWLLLFFEKVFTLYPDRPTLAGCFPNLELVIHGGIGFAPYSERFKALMAGTHAETREVYFASEGFMAAADRGGGEGLRLVLDGGVLFEFVPVSELANSKPSRFWIAQVETGREYAVVVSTCSGLWSYVLGDTVRFVDLDPPRLLITGRTSYVLSAVGEHLIAEEIDEAIRAASARLGASVTDYAVGCAPAEDCERVPAHLYIVEFAGAPRSRGFADRVCCSIDERLRELNRDYASYRANDYGLRPPGLVVVRPGTFAQWMKKRGRLGGQNKVPRIINDSALFADLRAHALCQYSGSGEKTATLSPRTWRQE